MSRAGRGGRRVGGYESRACSEYKSGEYGGYGEYNSENYRVQ